MMCTNVCLDSSYIYSGHSCILCIRHGWLWNILTPYTQSILHNHSTRHIHTHTKGGFLSSYMVFCMLLRLLCYHQISSCKYAVFCTHCPLLLFLLRGTILLLHHIHHQTLRCHVHYRVLLLLLIHIRFCHKLCELHTQTVFCAPL